MKRNLQRGDMVEVRSPREILASLGEKDTLEGLPFMPEMLRYCGHRFIVDKRADKVCDTIQKYHSQRIPNTVLLEDLRCDGSLHDNCQAECRLFWKDSWLRTTNPDAPSASSHSHDDGSVALADLTTRFAKQVQEVDKLESVLYRCQATELNKASIPLSVWDPRPYVHEFTSGNIPFGHFIRISLRAFKETIIYKLRRIFRRIFGRPPLVLVPLTGTRRGPPPDGRLNLKPGDCVQVKTKEEIAATLTSEGKDRGLWFDREMLPFCGGTYRVRQRITRFIDDRTGRMIEFKRDDCVTLEGVVCTGDLSLHRYFCPRAIYPYWREAWLLRATDQKSNEKRC